MNLVAQACVLPHVQELAEVEMVARVCKHLLSARLRCIVRRMLDFVVTAGASGVEDPSGAAVIHMARSYALVVQREMQAATLHFFNLTLGKSAAALRFWRDVLVPSVGAKFGGYDFPDWANREPDNKQDATGTNKVPPFAMQLPWA